MSISGNGYRSSSTICRGDEAGSTGGQAMKLHVQSQLLPLRYRRGSRVVLLRSTSIFVPLNLFEMCCGGMDELGCPARVGAGAIAKLSGVGATLRPRGFVRLVGQN